MRYPRRSGPLLAILTLLSVAVTACGQRADTTPGQGSHTPTVSVGTSSSIAPGACPVPGSKNEPSLGPAIELGDLPNRAQSFLTGHQDELAGLGVLRDGRVCAWVAPPGDTEVFRATVLKEFPKAELHTAPYSLRQLTTTLNDVNLAFGGNPAFAGTDTLCGPCGEVVVFSPDPEKMRRLLADRPDLSAIRVVQGSGPAAAN